MMKRISICLLVVLTATGFLGCATSGVTPPPTNTFTAVASLPRTPTPMVSPTATVSPPSTAFISVSEILKNPEAFRDKRVRIQGYGFTTATFPLCAGYVGLDRRTLFIDAQRAQIVAEVKWKPPTGARMYDPDHLRVFEGYVRIFSGEIGCPGAIKVETFPYLEVVEVH